MRKIIRPKLGEIGTPEKVIEVPKPIPAPPISPMKRPAPEPERAPEKIPVPIRKKK